jgi:hypothetical protein
MTIIQDAAPLHESMQALRSWGPMSLLAFAFTFAKNEEPTTTQQCTTSLCQTLRRHVRASDEVYLLDRSIEALTGLFFVLPEADTSGCEVVQKRLLKQLASALLNLDETLPRPCALEMRTFSSEQDGPTFQLRESAPACELSLIGTTLQNTQLSPSQPYHSWDWATIVGEREKHQEGIMRSPSEEMKA